MLGLCKDRPEPPEQLSSQREQDAALQSLRQRVAEKTKTEAELSGQLNAVLRQIDQEKVVFDIQTLAEVTKDREEIDSENDQAKREKSLLSQTLETVQESMEQLRAVPSLVATLKTRLESLRSERQTVQDVYLSQIKDTFAHAKSDRDQAVKRKEKVVRDVETVSEKLEYKESNLQRLETKVSDLKRLEEDVVQRKRIMRRNELLRNLEIICSKRVFMRLDRTVFVWKRRVTE